MPHTSMPLMTALRACLLERVTPLRAPINPLRAQAGGLYPRQKARPITSAATAIPAPRQLRQLSLLSVHSPVPCLGRAAARGCPLRPLAAAAGGPRGLRQALPATTKHRRPQQPRGSAAAGEIP